jgi:hypothetical protein
MSFDDELTGVEQHAPRTAPQNTEEQYSADPERRAELLDLGLRRAGARELLIDLDSDEAQKVFVLQFSRLKAWAPNVTAQVRPSAKPGHAHAIVTFPDATAPLTAAERIAYELALGSDITRGLLGLRQVEQGLDADASVLFEHPGAPDWEELL